MNAFCLYGCLTRLHEVLLKLPHRLSRLVLILLFDGVSVVIKPGEQRVI